MGSELIIDVKLGEVLFKIRASPDLKVYPGDEIYLVFPYEKIHVFDRKTEETII